LILGVKKGGANLSHDFLYQSEGKKRNMNDPEEESLF
jgi:hypothetical protein